MKKLRAITIHLVLLGVSAAVAAGQSGLPPQVVQATLTEQGGTPFYLQAVITERGDPDERVDVEMSWELLTSGGGRSGRRSFPRRSL